MMDDKRAAIGFGLAGILISALLLCASAHTVYAQEQEPETQTKPATTKRVSSSGRDPFRRYEPPRPTVKKLSGQVLPPSIQERIESYKAQKLAAMNARMPAPKPTTALLLNEIQVIGISRTPRGYAAIIEATPIKLSYVIYPGEPFYDTRLVFRHEIVFTDGRRERSVQLKSLRPTSPVNSLSAAGATVSVKP
jgi:hypothetical protein